MQKRYALVLLNDALGYTSDGEMFVIPEGLERQPVEWLDPWNCEHQETMCAMCVDTWNQDYAVWLPPGIDE